MPIRILRDDPIYQACLDEARKSPCQKKKVGAVLVFDGRPLVAEHNRPTEEPKRLCDPECIRLIVPNCDSALSACDHAEERLLLEQLRQGRGPFLAYHDLYVAALNADGTPERRVFGQFNCLRCARIINASGVRMVYTAWLGTYWVSNTPPDTLIYASDYALRRLLHSRKPRP